MTQFSSASEVSLAISLASNSNEILSVLTSANSSGIKLDIDYLKHLALSQSVSAGNAKVVALYVENITKNAAIN